MQGAGEHQDFQKHAFFRIHFQILLLLSRQMGLLCINTCNVALRFHKKLTLQSFVNSFTDILDTRELTCRLSRYSPHFIRYRLLLSGSSGLRKGHSFIPNDKIIITPQILIFLYGHSIVSTVYLHTRKSYPESRALKFISNLQAFQFNNVQLNKYNIYYTIISLSHVYQSCLKWQILIIKANASFSVEMEYLNRWKFKDISTTWSFNI